MLKIAKSHFKDEKASVLLIDKINKKKGKKGFKKKLNPKAGIFKKKVKKVSAKGTCYHCGKEGYWKKNCKEYLATVKSASVAKVLYMIQTNLSLSISILDYWVLDTAYDLYLCKSLQSLQEIKSLNKGDLELFGASGEFIKAEAMGTRILKLPLDKVLELKIIIIFLMLLEILFMYHCY